MPHFDRITQNSVVMGGRPLHARNQRVTVGMIVGQIGAGRTIEEFLKEPSWRVPKTLGILVYN